MLFQIAAAAAAPLSGLKPGTTPDLTRLDREFGGSVDPYVATDWIMALRHDFRTGGMMLGVFWGQA